MSKRMVLGDVAPIIARENRGPLDNLTMDSIAARRLGMSYGQYKSTHPHTFAARDAAGMFDKKEPRKQGYELICANCGGHFIGKSKDKKFCCDACRKAKNNKNYRQRQKAKEEDQDHEPVI